VFSSIIFFDLDNTLIEGPFGTAVFPIVLNEIARKTNCDPKEIRRQIVKENLDRQNDPHCSAVKAMDWDDIFAVIANRFGVTIEANAEEIVKAQAKDHSRLLNGAREILIALQHPSRALIVATKGLIKYQRPVLEALELTPYFAEILTPDSHNALKKDRAFYGEWLDDSLDQLLMPTRIMVGDQYVDDVVPPNQFGMMTVWKNEKISEPLLKMDSFERPRHFKFADDQPVKPTAIIKSLHELPNVIAQIEIQSDCSASLRVTHRGQTDAVSKTASVLATKQSPSAIEIAS